MEHTVRLAEGDTLFIEFEGYPSVLPISYAHAYEAMLQAELNKLQAARHQAYQLQCAAQMTDSGLRNSGLSAQLNPINKVW